MADQEPNAWMLSDEEWSQLCFMVVELGQLHQQLEQVLLDEYRPPLSTIWSRASSYQTSSQQMFDYLADCFRAKAGIHIQDQRKRA